MKKLFALALILLTINVQATISCTIRDRVESTVPEYMANMLECNNSAAISEDLGAIFDRFNICPADDQKAFSDIACKVVSDYVVDEMVKYVPTDWECKVTRASDLVKEMLIAKCKSYFGTPFL
jgi:aspartate carbamoyltransferase regulatory subunit